MNKPSIFALAAAVAVAAPLMASAATSHDRAAQSHSSAAGLTKAQAKNEIESDGYTHVQDLKQEKNGWTAKAMEGSKQVSLSVGQVTGVRKM